MPDDNFDTKEEIKGNRNGKYIVNVKKNPPLPKFVLLLISLKDR